VSESSYVGDKWFRCALERLVDCDIWGERRPKNPCGGRVYLDGDFQFALSACGAPSVDSRQETPRLRNWSRGLRGFDVVVRKDTCRDRLCVAELKVEKTDEVLWDLYKVIDALCAGAEAGHGAEAGYLVVAATNEQWKRTSNYCTEIFSAAPPRCSRQLFQDNKKAWLDLLMGGSARPLRIPAQVTISPIATSHVKIRGREGSLRCVRVAALGTEWLPFPLDHHGGDWPLGVEPPPA